jgi:hypothetical protein
MVNYHYASREKHSYSKGDEEFYSKHFRCHKPFANPYALSLHVPKDSDPVII